jgi:hypothetical protein
VLLAGADERLAPEKLGVRVTQGPRRLNAFGGRETKASIANKLSRGQFSAILFIDTLRAIGIARIDLQEI